MKAFLVLLVLSAAGLAGVLYFRKWIHTAPTAVVAPAEPAKPAKERRRRRHGARRLARNTVSGGAAPSSPGEASPGSAESAANDPPPGVYAPSHQDRAPLAPGGAAISEAAPDDVFGPSGPMPSQQPSGGRRPVVDEPPSYKPRPGDFKMVWQGEDLSQPDTMRIDLSNDSGGHDLTDAEIDARFRTKEDAVLGCVARSRPSEDADIPGRVTVKFRILRTGVVKGVQIEAPVILHKGGLTGCIKGVLASLRFPASSSGQVVSFPFSLI
ncbi:MAG TPA: hypothetical protein VHU40_09655 [Polyangia bacterium]|nr:hypothetical protein [Polyangia bacterium]